MIATFCLRLALGMLGTLFLLPARQMHPRFFRTHFVTVLGLCLGAAVLNWRTPLGIAAVVAAVLAFLGAVAWIFEQPPIGWTLVVLTGAAALTALVLADPPTIDRTPWTGRVADDLTAAALLGSAMTAGRCGQGAAV